MSKEKKEEIQRKMDLVSQAVEARESKFGITVGKKQYNQYGTFHPLSNELQVEEAIDDIRMMRRREEKAPKDNKIMNFGFFVGNDPLTWAPVVADEQLDGFFYASIDDNQLINMKHMYACFMTEKNPKAFIAKFCDGHPLKGLKYTIHRQNKVTQDYEKVEVTLSSEVLREMIKIRIQPSSAYANRHFFLMPNNYSKYQKIMAIPFRGIKIDILNKGMIEFFMQQLQEQFPDCSIRFGIDEVSNVYDYSAPSPARLALTKGIPFAPTDDLPRCTGILVKHTPKPIMIYSVIGSQQGLVCKFRLSHQQFVQDLELYKTITNMTINLMQSPGVLEDPNVRSQSDVKKEASAKKVDIGIELRKASADKDRPGDEKYKELTALAVKNKVLDGQSKSHDQNTALLWTIIKDGNNQVRKAEILLANSANPLKANKNGDDAYTLANKLEQSKAAQFLSVLLLHSPAIASPDSLSEAKEKSGLPIDVRLRQASANLIKVDDEGYRKLVQEAKSKGLINKPSTNGNTALHWAIDKGQHEKARILLANGANPFEKNKQGKDAFMMAREARQNAPVVQQKAAESVLSVAP